MWLHVSIEEIDGQFIFIDKLLEEGLIDDLIASHLGGLFAYEIILLLAHDHLVSEISIIVISFLKLFVFKLFHVKD